MSMRDRGRDREREQSTGDAAAQGTPVAREQTEASPSKGKRLAAGGR